MFNAFVSDHLDGVKYRASKSKHIVQYDNIPILNFKNYLLLEKK